MRMECRSQCDVASSTHTCRSIPDELEEAGLIKREVGKQGGSRHPGLSVALAICAIPVSMPTHVPCGLPSCAAPPVLQMMCQSWAETHPAYYAGLLDLTACTGDKTTVKGCSAAVNLQMCRYA